MKNPVSLIIEKNIVKEIPDTTIYVEKVYRNYNFKNVSITRKEGDLTIFLKAEKGRVFYNEKENKLIFLLENGNILTSSGTSISAIDFKNYEFTINLSQDFKIKKLEPKITELNARELKKIKNIDSSVEFHKKVVLSITILIFLILGFSIGVNLKQKNKILFMGIGGFIGIIFYEFLIIGEIIARKFGNPVFIYLPVSISVIGIKKLLR